MPASYSKGQDIPAAVEPIITEVLQDPLINLALIAFQSLMTMFNYAQNISPNCCTPKTFQTFDIFPGQTFCSGVLWKPTSSNHPTVHLSSVATPSRYRLVSRELSFHESPKINQYFQKNPDKMDEQILTKTTMILKRSLVTIIMMNI